MKKIPSDISGLSRRILDVVPDMLVLFDREGVILDIRNPRPELMPTYTPQEVIGMRITEEPLKKTFDPFMDYFRSVGETQKTCRFQYRPETRPGEVRFYEVFLLPVEEERILADIRHITDQAVAGIETRHLHYFFGEVLDNIAIPISVKSMETGRYLYWSRKAEVFGRTAAEMTGGTETLYMSPGQAQFVQQIDRELAEGKRKQYEGIEKYLLNDGLEHTFRVTRTPFVFGEERLILSSALDISELKETQASLLQAKNELAHRNMTLYSVLSLAKVIPWSCDLKEGIFYCDYNAYHPENADGPDAQGRYVIPMEHYFAGIHPDYRQDAIRMIDDLAEDRREEFHETYLVHWFNNREWEWVQVQSCVAERDAEGRPVRLIGSAQRITKQKNTELALMEAKEELSVKNVMLSSVLSLAQVIPWSGDLEAATFSCDYAVYHHESAGGPDAEGRYILPFDLFFSRVHPDYRAHAADQFSDLIEGRISEYHEIYPVYWYNDREYEWVEAQSSIHEYADGGRPRRLIGSVRIITDQKRMEESLRVAKEEAERNNTLKSAFLANMSHEIRTPLNAIVGFSELLADAETDEERREYLGIIQNSNALLLQLIGDILDLSKIEAGTLEFNFADYDLNALMDEVEQTARVKVTDAAVEVACTNRIPDCRIHTDRGRLLQVLHNFINNAVKFTRRGHIHFGCRKHTDGRWYFYVEDTGCGIPADRTASVFERFVKLGGKEQGTGLGLAISKSIVERLGGEIGVFSAEGQGSTFWFLLPAGCITAASVPDAGAEELPLPLAVKSPGPVTILVAEDDAANYSLFEAMLRKHYSLLHAWNGRQAVEMFREHRPNVILMDIKMPEMDGYEATAAIRKLSHDVPIVAVTAFAYPEDMRRILASGFDGCLPKPVSSDKLKRKITELYHEENPETP